MITNPNKAGDGRNARFLEPSPYADDGGENIGIDPRLLSVSDLRDLELNLASLRLHPAIDQAGDAVEVITGDPDSQFLCGRGLGELWLGTCHERPTSSQGPFVWSSDIVEFAGRFTDLKPKGSAFVGICPLHSEETPSFRVNPVLRTWHCFGACGRGGDVIELARLLMATGRW